MTSSDSNERCTGLVSFNKSQVGCAKLTRPEPSNISTALTSGAAFTIQGTASETVQPGMFYQEQAFGIGTVKLQKLNTWDARFTTEDGFSIRMTMYSDGKTNSNNVRFDLLPAYATFNPNFAGQLYGS